MTINQVAQEVDQALTVMQELLPISWKVRQAFVVKSMPSVLAKVNFFPDDDGGRSIEITISMQRLRKNGNWRNQVWTRVAHEWYHAFSFDHREAAAHYSKRADLVDALDEKGAEAFESAIMHYLSKN